jgi:hypothetical protein
MVLKKMCLISSYCWSQWPRGLRRRSSAARLLRLWVRISQGAWMFVCCECCVLSRRGFCDGLIIRPEESYVLWRVAVCDQETLKNKEAKARYRAVKIQPQWVVTPGKQINKHIRLLPLCSSVKTFSVSDCVWYKWASIFIRSHTYIYVIKLTTNKQIHNHVQSRNK